MDDIDIDDPSYLETLWELLCSFRHVIVFLFGLTVMLLLLSLFSFLYLRPGMLGYVIVWINTAMLSIFLVGLSYVLYQCRT